MKTRFLVAGLLGALQAFGLAPYSLWPVALVALALWVRLLEGRSVREAALLSYAFGIGFWLHGASWLRVSMIDFGGVSVPLAVGLLVFVALVMALFFALIGAIWAALPWGGRGWLALPLLWVVAEWLRTWVFTGFPWLHTGYGLIDTPLSGWAPLLGVYGVSFAAVLTATAGLHLVQHRRQAPLAIGLLGLVWIGGGLLQPLSWTTVDRDQPITATLVQGNIPQESKWALEWRDKTIERYQRLSEPAWGQDLLVWPEAAIPAFIHEATDTLVALHERGQATKTTFMTGIPQAQWNADRTRILYFNSLVALGRGDGLYHKQQLVPVGEYIPFEDWLRGTIPFFDLPMSSFTWGARDQGLLTAGRHAVAPFICYEIAYPQLVARQSAVADYLLTVSNDGWFGTSIGPDQHFEMVRMRARETGRYILRATNNGITAFIDPHGQVIDTAPRFEEAILSGVVYPARGLTPWQRGGTTAVISGVTLLLLLLVGLGWRQRRSTRHQ